ncbi:MAG: alpha/beta hydrolase [Halieaceae bacterium]
MFNKLKVLLLRWFYRWVNRRAWRKVDMSAVSTRDFELAGVVPVRQYRVENAQRVIIYIHGGGWVIGDLESHDPFCRQLAQKNQAMVIALDYRLAPEHRFPAAVEDCVAATRWIIKHRAELLQADSKVFLAGDSAGGNLAAVVANTLATELPDQLAGQILIYPAVRHYTPPTASHIENGKGYGLTYGLMVWFWDNYLGEKRVTENGDIDRLATPLTQPLPEGVAPALVLTASLDPLRDEGAEYAQKLSGHGVDCSHQLYIGEMHGFVCSEGLTDAHQQAMDLISGWIQSLSGHSPASV